MKKAFRPSGGIEEQFAFICGIPHGSGNEKALSDACRDRLLAAGLDVRQDAVNNLFVQKAATPGSEAKEPLMLQAHLDMVCAKVPESPHDFARDGLRLYVDEAGYIRAEGTTLGADDGYGVAYIMDILLREDIKHPKLECLLTVCEESGMLGAAAFDYSRLSASRIIALDSFGVERNTVSSCMGRRVDIRLAMEPWSGRGSPYLLSVGGLQGGHSAVDIAAGRGNANRALAHVLSALAPLGIGLKHAEGGQADNAIPASASACILIPKETLPEAQRKAAQADACFSKLFAAANAGASISLKPHSFKPGPVYTPDCMNLVLSLPDGVRAMDHTRENVVACSSNIGLLKTGDGALATGCMMRGNCSEWVRVLTSELEAVCSAYGAQLSLITDTPGMEYQPHSKLRSLYFDIAQKRLGKRPVEVATHGGLEIGYFAGNVPGADILTIGVEAVNAHTTEEAMSLKSFHAVYDTLIELIGQLA